MDIRVSRVMGSRLTANFLNTADRSHLEYLVASDWRGPNVSRAPRDEDATKGLESPVDLPSIKELQGSLSKGMELVKQLALRGKLFGLKKPVGHGYDLLDRFIELAKEIELASYKDLNTSSQPEKWDLIEAIEILESETAQEVKDGIHNRLNIQMLGFDRILRHWIIENLTASLVNKSVPEYLLLGQFVRNLSILILASIKRWKEDILEEARKCKAGIATPLNKASQEAEASGSGSGNGSGSRSGIRNGVEVTGGAKSKAAITAPLNEAPQEAEASGSAMWNGSEVVCRDLCLGIQSQ